MGIKGLTATVKKLSSGTTEALPANAHLIVDGDGWVFEILQQCEADGYSVLYGGDYVYIDSLVQKEIAYLRSLNLSLTFYFGGGSNEFKETTKQQRQQQRELLWLNVYEYCRNGTLNAGAELPIPTLGIHQIEYSLASLGVKIVKCDVEADQEIAKAVCEGNSIIPGSCFCYGKDR